MTREQSDTAVNTYREQHVTLVLEHRLTCTLESVILQILFRCTAQLFNNKEFLSIITNALEESEIQLTIIF